jgi:hypothetical protein
MILDKKLIVVYSNTNFMYVPVLTAVVVHRQNRFGVWSTVDNEELACAKGYYYYRKNCRDDSNLARETTGILKNK